MNEYQEALQNLYDKRSELIDVSNKNKQWTNNIQIYDFIGDQLRTLQQLVDKEKPMKPIYKYEGDKQYFCSNCNNEIRTIVMWAFDNYPYHADSGEIEYCPNCGQKLDWSDRND